MPVQSIVVMYFFFRQVFVQRVTAGKTDTVLFYAQEKHENL